MAGFIGLGVLLAVAQTLATAWIGYGPAILFAAGIGVVNAVMIAMAFGPTPPTAIQVSATTLRIQRAGAPVYIPLEEIRSLRIAIRRGHGHLQLHAATADHRLGDGLTKAELKWLRRWLDEHIDARRAVMKAEGLDPEGLVRAPEELAELHHDVLSNR